MYNHRLGNSQRTPRWSVGACALSKLSVLMDEKCSTSTTVLLSTEVPIWQLLSQHHHERTQALQPEHNHKVSQKRKFSHKLDARTQRIALKTRKLYNAQYITLYASRRKESARAKRSGKNIPAGRGFHSYIYHFNAQLHGP